MSSTKLTAPSRKVRTTWGRPKKASWIGTTFAARVPGFSPRASTTCRLMAVASAWAAATDTPGFRRPMAAIQRALGIRLKSLAAQNAMSSSQGRSLNPLGMTPITVRGSPSTWKDVPMTSAAPPRRRCQAS